MNIEFQHPDQQFKLVYGSHFSIWEDAKLDESVDRAQINDGIFLTLQNNGKYAVANNAPNSYPVLEMKFQYDNLAADSVTVVKGAGWYAVTKRFKAGETYTQGMKLKAVGGILEPVASDGSEDNLATVRVERVVSPDTLLVQKI